MATDEESLIKLHHKLVEVLGDNEADTLMSLLLPARWEWIARRHDVARPPGS